MLTTLAAPAGPTLLSLRRAASLRRRDGRERARPAAALALVLGVMLAGCSGEPAFLRQAHKEELIVDERLLALAVANTNLKAARLSARDGLVAVDRFVDAIDVMERASSDPATIRELAGASVAALREQALLLIHIPIAEDAEMTRLEQQMNALSGSVDGTLASLRAAGVLPGEALAAASEAWTEHGGIAAEVVRLSRENTNVRSFEVSVHEKRKVTRECLDALAALLTAVESGPEPAR